MGRKNKDGNPGDGSLGDEKLTVRLDGYFKRIYRELRDYLMGIDPEGFKTDSRIIRYAVEELHKRIFGGYAHDSCGTKKEVGIDGTTAENLYILKKMTGFSEPVILNLAVGKYLREEIERETRKREYWAKHLREARKKKTDK